MMQMNAAKYSDSPNVTCMPLAAPGLWSYRYKGIFGWIMIGAKDDADALKEARRSMSTSSVQIENLEKWNGASYVSAAHLGEKVMSKLDMDRVITNSLISRGWRPSVGAAIAVKTFETAVGPKDAHAYLEVGSRDGTHRALTGDYKSEGRNALEPRSVLIPKAAELAEVQSLAIQFAIEAEKVVSNTFAVTRHRPRPLDTSASTNREQASA